MTAAVALLCPVVSVDDIINTAGTGGESVQYVTGQPFLLFIGKERTNRRRPDELKFEA